jgi:hypothetical protein
MKEAKTVSRIEDRLVAALTCRRKQSLVSGRCDPSPYVILR